MDDARKIREMFAAHGRQMETIMALLSDHDCKKSEEHGCSCDRLIEEAEMIMDEDDEEVVGVSECDYCGGTGEITFTTYHEGVPDGVGEQECLCVIEGKDYSQD